MKGWNMFAEIKQLKNKGFNKSQVSRYLDMDYKTVNKYLDMSLEEYSRLKEKSKIRTKRIDKYRELIVSWLQEYSDMSTAQIYDWLKERHGDLDFKDRTLRLYVNNLREEYDLPKSLEKRQYEEVNETPMGYQAQVDLGEIWLKRL